MIRCRICGALLDRVSGPHLFKLHRITTDEYHKRFPNAPILSKKERSKLVKRNQSRKQRAHNRVEKSRWWRDYPEARKTQSDFAKAQARSPDFQTRGTEAARARWADPEFRKRRRAEVSVASARQWRKRDAKTRCKILLALYRGRDDSWQTEERRQAASDLMQQLQRDPLFISARNRAAKERWTDKEYHKRMRPILMQNLRRVRQRWTKPERIVRSWLKHLGLYYKVGGRFRPHQDIGDYNGDFVDHTNKIVLEVDGDYWHGPDRPKTQKRDKKKNRYLAQHGWTLLRLWESEIMTKPKDCQRRIQQLSPKPC